MNGIEKDHHNHKFKYMKIFSGNTTEAQLTLQNSNWANTITNEDATEYTASGYGKKFVYFIFTPITDL